MGQGCFSLLRGKRVWSLSSAAVSDDEGAQLGGPFFDLERRPGSEFDNVLAVLCDHDVRGVNALADLAGEHPLTPEYLPVLHHSWQ